MEQQLPQVLRAGARARQPLPVDGHRELREVTLAERQARRLAELDRRTGRIDLPVPPTPPGRPPGVRVRRLAPDPTATGGTVPVVRGAWLAKYDPNRAVREQRLPAADRTVDVSDVWDDFDWDDPAAALDGPWIQSWLMRGAGAGIGRMQYGDLVFASRTGWTKTDSAWLARRTVVGVWWVESTSVWPERSADGPWRWYSDAACFPVRRFNFPVPVNATRDMDDAFRGVAAFADRSRQALIELSAHDALALVRACGLPAAILSEPDPDRLAPMVCQLDLGPPSVVRQRILDGAVAVAQREASESTAREVAVAALRRARFAVVSTEDERGLGSDLWVRGVEGDGSVVDRRVEVKGLSGADPWAARLTWSELEAAGNAGDDGSWWLLIVTRTGSPTPDAWWLTGTEAARVFTVPTDRPRVFAADRAVARTL